MVKSKETGVTMTTDGTLIIDSPFNGENSVPDYEGHLMTLIASENSGMAIGLVLVILLIRQQQSSILILHNRLIHLFIYRLLMEMK
ncbi:hypothetical protein [Enterococcus sp. CWB-B31]|uniref:hypothetical protein n=1 Tax=Enterococcus sp. CWB-B31 TaxID=2885159 RepID=UPI001E5355F9|nr:hypothetical protein [Enterococcus sp. CWB-B31]MCB5955954.1 hypothetical protein [Enterococcus sp. CWB-B31]